MKSLNHHFSMAAAESDKDSGYSGLEKHCITLFLCCLAQTSLLLVMFDKTDSRPLQFMSHYPGGPLSARQVASAIILPSNFFGVELYVVIKFILWIWMAWEIKMCLIKKWLEESQTSESRNRDGKITFCSLQWWRNCWIMPYNVSYDLTRLPVEPDKPESNCYNISKM